MKTNPFNKRSVKNAGKAFRDTEATVKPVAKDTNKTRRKMKKPTTMATKMKGKM